MNDDQEKTIRIVHLSDIHFNKDIYRDPSDHPKLPGLYGSDPGVLTALTGCLSSLEFDALVISGDLSRIGAKQSFRNVKTWLESSTGSSSSMIGINLKDRNIPYIIVPGNHDRFNDGYKQTALDNYREFFPEIKADSVKTIDIKEIKINFHLYDSTSTKGGIGRGYVDKDHMVAKNISHQPNELHIAVMHHHVVQAPCQKRNTTIELINARETLLYLLASRFDAMLFGHTHNRYFEHLPAGSMAELIPKKREVRRIKGKIWLLELINDIKQRARPKININELHYQSRKTKRGKMASRSSLYDYYYLKHLKGIKKVKRPEKCDSPKQFYKQLSEKSVQNDIVLPSVKDMKEHRRVAVSMAPSPCQFGCDNNGFNLINFHFRKANEDEYRLNDVNADVYIYDGAKFDLKENTRIIAEQMS